MSEQQIDLEEKFPELEPISKPPSLWTVNGCGTGLYGRRNFDDETHTYIKTLSVCVLFIPVLALRAYRVADAERGWYFIGREPLSGFARFWNYMLACTVVGLIGVVAWQSYTDRPEFRAAQKLEEADSLAESGKVVEAARLYEELIREKTPKQSEALARFEGVVRDRVSALPLQQATDVVRIAVDSRRQTGLKVGGDHLLPAALEVAGDHTESDPRGALELTQVVSRLAAGDEKTFPAWQDLQEKLLESIVAAEPDDVDMASKLAVIYEQRGEFDKCESLLSPHADRLGTREGARILGQIRAGKGRYEQAHALLLPYVQTRLERLQVAEKRLQNAFEQARQRAFELMNADEDLVARYEAADEAGKGQLVETFLMNHLKNDRAVMLARQAMAEAGSVVPVALDFGTVLLRRAQSMDDPEARRAELEKAEEVFLAVRGQAGEEDEYRLSLGQVYYWLGRHEEGRKLFNEVLESRGRDFATLMTVGILLREVGARSRARTLIEEAYETSDDESEKQTAAMTRSLLYVDLDDRITWLSRADQSTPYVKAGLADARGNKALREGREDEAVTYLRNAIGTYGSMPESATTLNNRALASFAIYGVTGGKDDFDRGVEMLQKAVALSPRDSILLFNAASMLYSAAVRELIGEEIDFSVVKQLPDVDTLRYLYADAAEREELIGRLKSHQAMQKSIAYMKQVNLLAPKQPQAYQSLAEIYGFTRDADSLTNLRRRLSEVELDRADRDRRTRDFYAGKNDEKKKRELQSALKRAERRLAAAEKIGGPTYAFAAVSLAEALASTWVFGDDVEADRAVELCQSAHAAAPSEMTRWSLISMLCLRASQRLAERSREFDAMVEQSRRSLPPLYLMAIALSGDEPLRQLAYEIDDLRRACRLVIESTERFPESGSPLIFAMLRHVDPEEAKRVGERVKQDEVGRLKRAVAQQLSPLSASAAFDACWAHELAGRDAEARTVIKQCADRGVPMPNP